MGARSPFAAANSVLAAMLRATGMTPRELARITGCDDRTAMSAMRGFRCANDITCTRFAAWLDDSGRLPGCTLEDVRALARAERDNRISVTGQVEQVLKDCRALAGRTAVHP